LKQRRILVIRGLSEKETVLRNHRQLGDLLLRGRNQMKPVVPLNSRQADDPQLPDLLPSLDALPPPTTDDPLHHPVVLPLFAAPPYHPVARRLPLVDLHLLLVARRLPLVDLHPGTTDTHHLVDGAALPDGGPQGGFLLGAE